jgi:hypothetical protein
MDQGARARHNRLYLDLNPTATGKLALARRKGTGLAGMSSGIYPIAVDIFATGYEAAA